MTATNFRVEYETEKALFKAQIIATSTQEAIAFLRTVVKVPLKIISTSNLGAIDAITKEAIKMIVIEGDTPTKPDNFKCPFCEYSAKTEKGLQIHIGRSHKD